jgi:L-amino acid N-acyltransferase YncA
MVPEQHARAATPDDAHAIARIYNEGIEDRVATFEVDLRSESDIRAWFERKYPIVVVERAPHVVVAFASSSPTSARRCYARNADFSIFVARHARRSGAGRLAMTALIEAARAAGLAKLISGVFPQNAASRALLRELGFREVGTYERHGQLDGAWRDVIIVERLVWTSRAPPPPEAAIPPRAPRGRHPQVTQTSTAPHDPLDHGMPLLERERKTPRVPREGIL